MKRNNGNHRTRTHVPDARGYFGPYGGRYAPETLMPPLLELETAYAAARRDPAFRRELNHYLTHYVGRPTPLTEAPRFSEAVGVRVLLKREDLCHTGAHKINNALGQALLARRMEKKHLIAETGAGQHGVATATVAALLGMKCRIYMGAVDMARQALNVYRMRCMGAEVIAVTAGQQTLKEAISEAMRDWVTHVRSAYYLLGSALGPHPYPMMVRDFQRVIGQEARRQCLKQTGRMPSALVACVGGGSNAMGLFHAFRNDTDVRLIGVEAGGLGIAGGKHAARFAGGSLGVLQGTRTYVLQDENGQIASTHSVSAGLDYAAIGPEHAWLRDQGRAEYVYVSDQQAVSALKKLAEWEGLLAALESAHAIAYVIRPRVPWKKKDLVLVNLSGRGDKDVAQLAEWEAQQKKRSPQKQGG